MLTEQQIAMFTTLERYCRDNDTSAWVGNSSDLRKIGGQELLYELEQTGVVTINRINEKWIVCPNRVAGGEKP